MTEPLWSALDITQRPARDFLFSILDEYMELFAGSKVFHIGGDEFIDFNHFELFPSTWVPTAAAWTCMWIFSTRPSPA